MVSTEDRKNGDRRRRLFSRIVSTFPKPVLGKRRLLFCINSGRSGSKYLAELLGTAVEVTSFHEAEPTMTGQYVRMVNEACYPETIGQRRLKSKAIKTVLRSFPSGHVYCDTTHMFIKTLYDVIMNDFRNVDVIILRRELSLVLKSFIELQYFSKKNKVWPDWLTSPNAKTTAIQCIAPDGEMDQYDLCIAYLVDMEARSQRFKVEYPWVNTHEVRIEALNTYANVETLFGDLRVTPTERTKRMVGRVCNIRAETKQEFKNPVDLQYCRHRIETYIMKAMSAGICLPTTLALDEC